MNFYRRFKYYILGLLIILYLFFYTSSSISFIFYSISKPFIYYFYRTQNNIDKYFLKNKKSSLLLDKNIALKKQNESLNSLLALYQGEVEKYSYLNSIFLYRNKVDSTLIGNYNILSMYNIGNKKHIIINSGLKEHVKKGDYVIYKNFLLGQISKVTRYTSEFTFLFDESIMVDGKIPANKGNFYIGYCFKKNDQKIFRLFLKDLRKKNDFKNELITTAGISDFFGRNLVIGKVGKIIAQKINRIDYEILLPYDFRNMSILSIYRKN